MTQKIKIISPKEFQELGFLQELNRIFLHPLGMALSIEVCFHDDRNGQIPHKPEDCPIPDGKLDCIWDYRDHPEGIAFDPEDIKANQQDYINKASYVAIEWQKHIKPRLAAGFNCKTTIHDVQTHVYVNPATGTPYEN
jgi:hypothetical protein